MPRDLQPYRNQDGSFDLTFYQARAARLRQKAIAEFMGTMFGRAVDWIGRVRHSGNRAGFGFTTSGRAEGGQAHTILARDVETLPSRAFLHP